MDEDTFMHSSHVPSQAHAEFYATHEYQSSAFLDAAEDEALTPPLPSLHAFVVFDTGLVIVDEEAVSDILSSPLPMGVPYYDDVLPCWRWRVLY
ncbi:hypothetical protein SCP_0706090 [Sparassis crispa]|uniref:Uncharacterized protein n=1 Tax=Sparassis crispa TaxID=139825 RepID=A0A401GT67_9APHY|nr:hypothetical protein SCP_0706090 [Sparassis crispa]GBE85422.1 hypothetical protein SCP_0706090 [Sparassis crispa]